MAEQKISLNTKWGKKDEVTFKVDAKTLKEAGDELNTRDEWGKFEGDITYDYKSTGGLVTEVTLKPSYTLSMPKWSGYDKAPQACQQEWDRMYKKLVEHEDGHRDVHAESLAKIEKWLEKAKDLKEKTFFDDFKKLVKEMQDNQKKFDKDTDHGAKKGVELNIAEECE
jgi:predicted secreted Zn-dependent protease